MESQENNQNYEINYYYNPIPIKEKRKLVADIDKERGWKVCKICNQQKELNCFSFKKDNNVYHKTCKNCENIAERAKSSRKPKKPKAIEIDLQSGSKYCERCHSTKPILEFYFRYDDNCYRKECKQCTIDKKKSPRITTPYEKGGIVYKKCKKCLIDKPEKENFYYRPGRDVYYPTCNDCRLKPKPIKKAEIAREKNKKECCICHIEKELNNFYYTEKCDRYINKCKTCYNNSSKNNRKQKHESLEERPCQRCKTIRPKDAYTISQPFLCKECRFVDNRIHYAKHKDKYLKYRKKYEKTKHGKQKIQEGRRRRSKIPENRIKYALRARVREAIKSDKKSARTMELVGCKIKFLRKYIEFLWESGMSWSNYGYGKISWQLDHIYCCELFDMSDPIQQKWCFHYSNMKPMWRDSNNDKSDWLDNNKRARHLSWQEKLQYLESKGFNISLTKNYDLYLIDLNKSVPSLLNCAPLPSKFQSNSVSTNNSLQNV